MEWLFGQNFGFCNSVCCSFKPDSKSENQIFQLTQTTIWNSTKAEEEDSKKEQICNKSRDLSRLEYKQSISQFTISRGHFPRDFFTNFNTSSDLHPLATNHTVLKLSILSTFIFGQNLSFDTVCWTTMRPFPVSIKFIFSMVWNILLKIK